MLVSFSEKLDPSQSAKSISDKCWCIVMTRLPKEKTSLMGPCDGFSVTEMHHCHLHKQFFWEHLVSFCQLNWTMWVCKTKPVTDPVKGTIQIHLGKNQQHTADPGVWQKRDMVTRDSVMLWRPYNTPCSAMIWFTSDFLLILMSQTCFYLS